MFLLILSCLLCGLLLSYELAPRRIQKSPFKVNGNILIDEADVHIKDIVELPNMRQEMNFRYSTTEYPFLQCVREILEIEVGLLPQQMELLHLSETGREDFVDKSGNKMNRLIDNCSFYEVREVVME